MTLLSFVSTEHLFGAAVQVFRARRNRQLADEIVDKFVFLISAFTSGTMIPLLSTYLKR